MTITLVHPVREAARLGAAQGRYVAGWFDIDNPARIIELDDNCELGELAPNPLPREGSGDYPSRTLFVACVGRDANFTSDGDDALCDELCEEYESAYFDAWRSEVLRRANYQLTGE